MQIKTGTCSITNGTNRVIAAPGIDWSAVVAGASWFSPVGSSIVYSVATTTAPGVSASGNWELTVTGVITDATNAVRTYSIHKDFTVNLSLPIIEPGDVQTAQIWARMVASLDLTWPAAAAAASNNASGMAVFTSIGGAISNLTRSGSISNVTWVSTGVYSIVLTNQADNLYGVALSCSHGATGATAPAFVEMYMTAFPTTTGFNIATWGGPTTPVLTDREWVCVVIFRAGGVGGVGSLGNPMTTTGDIIIGGTAGVAQRLAAGAAGTVLTAHGTATLPTYTVPAAGGSGTGQGYQEPAAQTATSTIASTQNSYRHNVRLTLNAGSSAYVTTFSLPTASRVAGDQCSVHADIAASTNPQLIVESGGVTLYRYDNTDGSLTELFADFVFNGTLWKRQTSGFIT